MVGWEKDSGFGCMDCDGNGACIMCLGPRYTLVGKKCYETTTTAATNTTNATDTADTTNTTTIAAATPTLDATNATSAALTEAEIVEAYKSNMCAADFGEIVADMSGNAATTGGGRVRRAGHAMSCKALVADYKALLACGAARSRRGAHAGKTCALLVKAGASVDAAFAPATTAGFTAATNATSSTNNAGTAPSPITGLPACDDVRNSPDCAGLLGSMCSLEAATAGMHSPQLVQKTRSSCPVLCGLCIPAASLAPGETRPWWWPTTTTPAPEKGSEEAKAEVKAKAHKTRELMFAFAKMARETLKTKECKDTGPVATSAPNLLGYNMAALDCAELRAEIKKQGDVAKATYATLRTAKSACGSAEAKPAATPAQNVVPSEPPTTPAAATTAAPATTEAAATDDYAGFTCEEIEAEIKVLKAEAAAAGVVLEPSTSNSTTTTPGAGSGAGAAGVAAGVSALVAVAFVQLV